MSRYIDADALNDNMYHEAFENDASYDERNPMAKWESGLWIRYKMFENCLDNALTIETKQIKYFDEDEKVWKIGEVIVADRKTEPQTETKTETKNSNLTFEKVMKEIQTQVIEFPDTHQKFIFARKIEMDSDSIKIGGWEYKGVKDGEREGE